MSNDGYDPSPIEEEDFAVDEPGTESISFFVGGQPQQKGSTRSFYIKKLNRVVTTSSNKDLKQWELRIANEAQRANEKRRISFYSCDDRCGYGVSVEFVFARPKSLPKRVKHDTKRPDLDKLVRAVLDGLTMHLIPDDSQVVVIQARKRYAAEGDTPGARIIVKRIP
ncbi:MAG TPA: RusA family crossover junction endodeoxyribonuclease [Methanomassiliicoccales archaeon]|jgi:Holliday junction resolvase RusA-like endonuclease|nr:RusA family crossover junction endodeoxyribonuclease [Methanomassiliicoccales archaeon]